MAESREGLESRGWGLELLLCSGKFVLPLSFFGEGLGQVWVPKPWLWSEPFPAQTLHQARTKTTTGLEGEEH